MKRQSATPDNMQKEKPFGHASARERIVAEARRHFFAYGFRSVTMDDLAKGLGMSKKTLYRYFPSKIALLEAVLIHKSRDVEKDLQRITSGSSPDFLASLQELLARMQEHLAEIRPPFLRDMKREGPEIFRLVETRRKDLFRHYFGKFIGQGCSAGIIRNDIPARLIVEILIAATEAIMNPPKLTEFGLTPKAGFSAIITVILEGVITDTGRSIV